MTAELTRRALLAATATIISPATPALVPPATAWAAGPVPAKPASSLILGALFPASGALALGGDEAWRGVALAVAMRHQPVRIIRGDASDPAKAIEQFAGTTGKTSVKTPRVTAILGSYSSATSFAATAAAELANLPYIELDAPADAITGRGFKTLLRTGLTTSSLAATAAAAIAGLVAPGWHKPATALRIGLLFDVGATDGSFAAAMIGACKAARLPILMSMGHATATVDFGDMVGRMKRAKLDLLVHAGRPEHVLLLYEALAVASWRPRMIIGAGAGYGLTDIAYVLGRALDNTMVVGAPLYQASGPSAAIAAAYRARYARAPRGAGSLVTYVGATAALAALRPGTALVGALRAANQPRGALANGWGLAFDANGQNRRGFPTLQQWRHGTLVTIDPAVAGAAKPVLTL